MPYRDRWPEEFLHVARVDDDWIFAAKKNPRYRFSEPWIIVLESRDNGRSWRPISLRRTIGAFIYQHAHFNHSEWPPGTIEEFAWDAPHLRVRYVDLDMDAPHGYLWDALYSPRRRRWTVKKVGLVGENDWWQ